MVSFWALGIANIPLMGVTNSWLKKSRSRNIASAPSNERVHISSSGSILVALNRGMFIAIKLDLINAMMTEKISTGRPKHNAGFASLMRYAETALWKLNHFTYRNVSTLKV